MSYRELFQSVHRRPQLHGLDGSYGAAVAYVLGCDAGTEGVMLAGFREWLIVRIDDGHNLAWPALVSRVADAEERMTDSTLTKEEDDKFRVEELFRLLDEFFERKGGKEGMVRIYYRYGEWLKGQSWYRPEMLE